MRLISRAAITSLFLFLFSFLPASGFCQLTEGFEHGIPAGWSFSGETNPALPPLLDGTAQVASGITPTEGSSYAWISTGCSPTGTCPDVAAAVTPPYAFLGLGAGTGLGAPTTEVTLTSPSFSLLSPGVVSFDVNFITTDGTNGFADFALVQLMRSDTTPINLFVANTTCAACTAVPPVSLNSGVATLSPSQAVFAGTAVTFGSTTYGGIANPKFGGGPGGPTGWIHVTYPAAAGNYQLQFLVSHVGDTTYPSALGIDNVQVQTTQTVTQPLQPGATDFSFNTGASVTKQTIDYTGSGTNPTGTTMQVTLRGISNSEFQNLVAGTFAQGSQCFQQDFGNGVFGCAVTIALCTTPSNTTPLGANCPQGTTGSIGVTEKFFTSSFVNPTSVPRPAYLAATDNALSCTNDPSNTCRALHDIFSQIVDDCCAVAGKTKTFNSLFIPVYNLPFQFSAFSPHLFVDADATPSVVLAGAFTLAAGSPAINLLTDPVSLQFGAVSATLPAGSFTKQQYSGLTYYQFQGAVSGGYLNFLVLPLGRNKFIFTAAGQGIDLTGLTNPVKVLLGIGNNVGIANVTTIFN
ncbi:MAG: hypothetical protein M3O09_09560 [Acidobacteriota bacterium]|nr:hypothetical protein [Acidobacteriota bacterium]